ncbi:TauD/TfdA dioxygenase family protein [Amnibacterium kyonggiense]
MQQTVLSPIGLRLEGVDLAAGGIAPEELQRLLAEHGVVVLPRQTLDDAQFADFLRTLGDLTFTKGETPVEGHPDLNVISNVGRAEPPRSSWHVDTSYVARIPAYTALRTVEVPEVGGETLFTDQYRAYETLPDALRDELAGRTITHAVTGVELGPDDESSADHDVFRTHPISGRTAVYISTPSRCVAVSGMDDAQAARTVQEVFDHSTRPDNVLRHAWAPGDVVVWDNRCVLHKADHSGVVGDRVMHRGMVLEPAA